jgi:hypothetical protein
MAYLGNPIEPDEAWRIFDRWKTDRDEVGIILWGRSGNVYTHGSVASARSGRLQIRGDSFHASFNLAGARFRYGPMQGWPRWPSPPVVEVTALSAELPGGDYLVLASGLRPESIGGLSLPA